MRIQFIAARHGQSREAVKPQEYLTDEAQHLAPLTKNGKRDSKKIFKGQEIPKILFASDAVRTGETISLAAPGREYLAWEILRGRVDDESVEPIAELKQRILGGLDKMVETALAQGQRSIGFASHSSWLSVFFTEWSLKSQYREQGTRVHIPPALALPMTIDTSNRQSFGLELNDLALDNLFRDKRNSNITTSMLKTSFTVPKV